jgi:class 3 adenylate cyclase
LHTERWPGELALRVGMAMHTGEADLRAGDYYGAAVTAVLGCARSRMAVRC